VRGGSVPARRQLSRPRSVRSPGQTVSTPAARHRLHVHLVQVQGHDAIGCAESCHLHGQLHHNRRPAREFSFSTEYSRITITTKMLTVIWYFLYFSFSLFGLRGYIRGATAYRDSF